MSEFAWAVIGPGAIAQRFADAVWHLPQCRVHGVLGQRPERAAAFAARWQQPGQVPMRVYADLPALLDDAQVHGVYIATPHVSHAPLIEACLHAHRPVLCEKPLVVSAAQALPLLALAQQKQVFLMEALWSRFLPIYAVVGAWLRSGVLGPLRAIQSSFCFLAPFQASSRLFDPALAGGSLLDIGIYNLAISRWVLQQAQGDCPEPLRIQADGLIGSTGVDVRVAGTLVFPQQIMVQFVCGFDGQADNALRIIGERGCITLPHHFWEATEAWLDVSGQARHCQHAPMRINGFEGEIEAAMHGIRLGQVESPHLPHADTLAVLRWMDTLRQQLGVIYPFERPLGL